MMCDTLRVMDELQLFTFQDSTTRIVVPDDAPAELEHMNLTSPVLVNACLRGHSEAAMRTALSPMTAPGTSLWFGTIEGLRQQAEMRLPDLGWSALRLRNGIEVLRNEELGVQIAARRGNENTGIETASVQAAAKRKGNSTIDLVFDNVHILTQGLDVRNGRYITFWLLYHYEKENGVDVIMRSELSLPDKFDKGNFAHWNTRILLGEYPLNSSPVPESIAPSGDGDNKIVVDVERKLS